MVVAHTSHSGDWNEEEFNEATLEEPKPYLNAFVGVCLKYSNPTERWLHGKRSDDSKLSFHRFNSNKSNLGHGVAICKPWPNSRNEK